MHYPHFFQNCGHFQYNISWLCFDLSWWYIENDHNFERNEDRATVFLKWTDFIALYFYRSQNVLGWFNFFEPDQKFIYVHIVAVTNIMCQTKRWFEFSDFFFVLAQNILGPVKGQGIYVCFMFWSVHIFVHCRQVKHFAKNSAYLEVCIYRENRHRQRVPLHSNCD